MPGRRASVRQGNGGKPANCAPNYGTQDQSRPRDNTEMNKKTKSHTAQMCSMSLLFLKKKWYAYPQCVTAAFPRGSLPHVRKQHGFRRNVEGTALRKHFTVTIWDATRQGVSGVGCVFDKPSQAPQFVVEGFFGLHVFLRSTSTSG